MGGCRIYRANAISQAIKLPRRRRNNISTTFLRSSNSLRAVRYYLTPSASYDSFAENITSGRANAGQSRFVS